MNPVKRPTPCFDTPTAATLRSLAVLLVFSLLHGCASHPKPPPRPHQPSVGQAVVHDALSMRGIPYRWGEETPERGFDCSGLVQYVYGRHGINLPRTAYLMAHALPELDSTTRQPGDLVFFNTTGKPYSHVGIYMGGGRFVHASSSKGQVTVSELDTPFWTKHFLGMRRPSLALADTQEESIRVGHWIP